MSKKNRPIPPPLNLDSCSHACPDLFLAASWILPERPEAMVQSPAVSEKHLPIRKRRSSYSLTSPNFLPSPSSLTNFVQPLNSPFLSPFSPSPSRLHFPELNTPTQVPQLDSSVPSPAVTVPQFSSLESPRGLSIFSPVLLSALSPPPSSTLQTGFEDFPADVDYSTPLPDFQVLADCQVEQWKGPVWLCFESGTKIRFIEPDITSIDRPYLQSWTYAEELASREQLENITSSCAPHGLKVLNVDMATGHPLGLVFLYLTPFLLSTTNILAEFGCDHPFYVGNKGWCSLNPDLTYHRYGMACSILEIDDVCICPSSLLEAVGSPPPVSNRNKWLAQCNQDCVMPDQSEELPVKQEYNEFVFPDTPQCGNDVMSPGFKPEATVFSFDYQNPSPSTSFDSFCSNPSTPRTPLYTKPSEDTPNPSYTRATPKAKSKKAKGNPEEKTRRPMNGFMIFAQRNRMELIQKNPGKDNSRSRRKVPSETDCLAFCRAHIPVKEIKAKISFYTSLWPAEELAALLTSPSEEFRMEDWAGDIAQMISDSESSGSPVSRDMDQKYGYCPSPPADQIYSPADSELQFEATIEFKSDDNEGDVVITSYGPGSPSDSHDSMTANVEVTETKFSISSSNHSEFLLHPETIINLGSAFEVTSSYEANSDAEMKLSDDMEGSTYCTSTTNYSNPTSPVKIGTSKDDEAPKRVCLVCGDSASGFHYGVASCEACKAFFKRTIQGNIEYQCPSSGECEINKRRRKACQACRYHKCIRVGMLKEGVRLDRVRGGRQKYRKVTHSSTEDSSPVSQRRPSLEENKTLIALSQAEPEILAAACETTYPDSSSVLAAIVTGRAQGCSGVSLLTTLSEVYDRELVAMIGWAKQVPGFADLPIGDQMRLLQYTWPEVLSLSLAFRSANGDGKLRFATEVQVTKKQAVDSGLGDFYDYMVQLMDRLESTGVSKEEYLVLKAVALSNCDYAVDEPKRLRELRDSLLGSLHDVVSSVRNTNSPVAVSQLLLLLPCLRQADVVLREAWNRIRRQGRVSMNKLFVEMLDPSIR